MLALSQDAAHTPAVAGVWGENQKLRTLFFYPSSKQNIKLLFSEKLHPSYLFYFLVMCEKFHCYWQGFPWSFYEFWSSAYMVANLKNHFHVKFYVLYSIIRNH